MSVSRIAYVNGRYLPRREAVVNVEDRGYQFSDGVYEVCEVRGGRLIDERRHMQRLVRSLGELRMPLPMPLNALGVVLRETVRRNRVQDGLFSPWLFEVAPGALIDMKGPLGYFVWKAPVSDSVLVATGTGIAPFRGMLMEYLAAGGDRQITLVFGVRYEESLLYRAEFETMSRAHPNFRFIPVLSRPDNGWTGGQGHVQEHVLDVVGRRRDMDVYICGLKLMVDDMRARLTHGIAE